MNAQKIVLSLLFSILLLLSTGAYGKSAEMIDRQISTAVKNELIMVGNMPIRFRRLGVETSRGIVTLTGSVDNLLAKERAEQITENVRGVRAVINRIEVAKIENIEDNVIKDRVEMALSRNPATDIYEIKVSVKDHVVTLSGNVDSWQERKLAADTVKEVRGVTDIRDKISIRNREDRSDVELEQEIREVLKWDVYLHDALIEVDVKDGVAYLSGAVGRAAEKTTAFNDAFVPGINSVDATGLKIDSSLTDEDLRDKKYVHKPDSEIRKAVIDAIRYDPRIIKSDINVEVKEGTVILSGLVSSLMAKTAAKTDALNTVGVVDVRNYIDMGNEIKVSDGSIEDNIERAIRDDPLLYGYHIEVRVVNGIVWLMGTVDTDFEKELTEELVSEISGVKSVDNRLSVNE